MSYEEEIKKRTKEMQEDFLKGLELPCRDNVGDGLYPPPLKDLVKSLELNQITNLRRDRMIIIGMDDVDLPKTLTENEVYNLDINTAEERIQLRLGRKGADKLIKDLCKKFNITDSELIRINTR